MNNEIKMSVSSMTRIGEEKALYVMFSDSTKTVEFVLPGCKMLRNKGFSDEEVKQLKDYLENEQDHVYAMAKTINPLRAILGE